MYSCYNYNRYDKSPINSKNYKYKSGIVSMLPLLIIRLFNFIKLPDNLNLFNKSISVREELTETYKLDYSKYRSMLNSDLTILIGISLTNNKHLQELLLTDLNLYSIDVSLLI